MKTTFSTLIFLILANFSFGQSWNSYKDKYAVFSISLPAIYKLTENTSPGNSSRTVKADFGDYTNIVSIYDSADGLKGDPFMLAAEMIMAGMDPAAKLVKKSDFYVNGKKGLRALFFIPSQNFYIDKGVVVDGKFAYSVLQIRSNKDDSSVADKMFSSINQ